MHPPQISPFLTDSPTLRFAPTDLLITEATNNLTKRVDKRILRTEHNVNIILTG